MDAGRRRLEYVRRDPRVSLTVLASSGWRRHITLHGRLVALRADPNLTDLDRISLHYTGCPYDRHRDRARVSGWIEVVSWHAWDTGNPWV
jgi:hypothetical protein